MPSSAATARIPFLSMVLSPWLLTRRLTQRFSSGIKNFLWCRLGSSLTCFLRFEWDTLFPIKPFFPVTSHTRLMIFLQSLLHKYRIFQQICQDFSAKFCHFQLKMEVRGVEPLSKIPFAFAHTCVSFAFEISLFKTPVKVGAYQKLSWESQVLLSGGEQNPIQHYVRRFFPAGEGKAAALRLGSECVLVVCTYVF